MSVENELKSLPTDTVRLIGSSQVITSVYSVVKELIENSLDAKSTSVDIKLENYGLDKIEVRDNGSGISNTSLPIVAKRYHTSKISSFSDLERLTTYGFRGEALGSLCAVSSLSVTSKSVSEEVSHVYTFDHHGNVLSCQPSHVGQGTTVAACQLFKILPVRRQFYNTNKKKKDELKRVEDLLMVYGVIRPDIRLILKNNKDVVWQKNVMADSRSALQGILGRNVMAEMVQKTVCQQDPQITLVAFLPKTDADVALTSRSTCDRSFLAVNGRPVCMRELEKCVRQHYCSHTGCSGRYPIFYLSLALSAGDLDVNVDPNKTRMMFHHQDEIMAMVTSMLEEIYGQIQKSPSQSITGSIENNNVLSTHVIASHESTPSVCDERLNDTEESCNKVVQRSCNKSHDRKLICETGDSGSRITINSESEVLMQAGDKQTSSDATLAIGLIGKTEMSSLNAEQCENGNVSMPSKELESINSNLDIAKETAVTSVDKGDFSIFDEEFEMLMKACENSTQDSKSGEGIRKDTFHDSNSATDDVNTGCSSSTSAELSIDTGSHKVINDNSISWSKGTSRRQEDGQPVEPAQLLVGTGIGQVTRKRPLSPSNDLEMMDGGVSNKKRQSDVELTQPKLYDMLGSSTTEKLSTGFMAFSREVRPKLVAEHSSASYDELSQMLREQWNSLSPDQQREYAQTGAQALVEVKNKVKVEGRRRLANKLEKKIVSVKGMPSIKDQLLAASKADVTKTVPVKSVQVSFSLTHLRQTFKTGIRYSQTQMSPTLQLIGPLKFYNGFICCHGNEIKVTNPHRVEEVLVHRELMANHVLSTSKLDTPIRITESSVGGAAMYQRLVGMVPLASGHTYTYIDDVRLKANGIQVRCHADQDDRSVFGIVGLTTAIPTYGISDLQEILELAGDTQTASLAQCRPAKVTYYLQGEAVRMVRQRPLHRTFEDVSDILEQMEESLPVDCVTCLHDKPFLHTLYDIDNIPVTQSVSQTG